MGLVAGSVSPIKGSSSPVTQTSWFAPIPDLFNMLRPFRLDSSVSTIFQDQTTVCNYFNQFWIWDLIYGGAGSSSPTATLGGFTIAPDGTTNTAQAFVESSTNTAHFAMAGMNFAGTGGTGDLGLMRLAGYFKYSGRRLVFWIHAGEPGFSSDIPSLGSILGVNIVFDLLNGAVGVAPAYTNTVNLEGWSIVGSGIQPAANGFYFCYLDVHCQTSGIIGNGNKLFGSIWLDNGTGSNPISLTYTGDGVSGVYGWRTNMMPIQAYGMSGGRLFYDDFDDPTLSKFDVNNTLAPGFKWYLTCAMPALPNNPACPLSSISVANSILTLTNQPTQGDLQSYTSATGGTAPGTPVGNYWKPPFLFEYRMSYSYEVQPPMAVWSQSVEWMMNQPNTSLLGTPVIGLMGRELDFTEDRGSNTVPWPQLNSHLYEWQTPSTGWTADFSVTIADFLGAPVWNSGRTYGVGFVCSFNGVFYQCTNLATGAGQSPTNGSFWETWTSPNSPDASGFGAPTEALEATDFTTFNTFSHLLLPYDTRSGAPGMHILFYNGIFSSAMTWTPQVPGNTPTIGFYTGDGQSQGIFLGTGVVAGNQLNVDWVSVKQ